MWYYKVQLGSGDYLWDWEGSGSWLGGGAKKILLAWIGGVKKF